MKLFRSLFYVLFACSLIFLSGVSAQASSVPQVVVSIKPLHSLVSAVMGKLGTPALIVKQAGSEHGYALKPSDAKILSKADIIFIANPDMELFLVKPIENLGVKDRMIALSSAPGVELLPIREGGLFEDHGDEHHHGGDTAHAMDFHFWLDPENARKVVAYVADVLAKKDPDHAEIYHNNANAYDKVIVETEQNIKQSVAPVSDENFIVFHDAYQYFEHRFGLHAIGSVALDPERQPGAQRISAIKNTILQQKAVCVFAEPQYPNKLVDIVIESTPAKVGMLDPLGQSLPEGAGLYPELIANLADNLVNCLTRK
ncbi:zinc ABC transporter substrate-binding protein [Bartonella sp. W8122]|uniref:zinc ABC transporter substrate-binding protein n=1 Tax=Bartonella sp. W8122 TaxID=2750930 RepID=UPI0018DBD9B3|nr:zinc ABC transporter substrate-binding protein [Bartonella sp. W8122]MBI0002193.1 zinc ABC transporter substrate-binding protein [Bartonella sp. W8122]